MALRPMTVLMPFHTPFYAPLAAGVTLGHFSDEGLEVTAIPAAVFGKATMAALCDGDIEISLGGLMRSFDLADRSGAIIVHFAEVCSRSGFFLLSREPLPSFRWPDLVGKTVISFAEAPTPWQCMLTVLRRNGVDPAGVRIEHELPGPEAVAAFRAGHGDFLEQTQPIVEQLIAEGAAHLVASMGEATGPVPFTSYMTTPRFLEREPDVMLRFTCAVYRTQRWLAAHEARVVAGLSTVIVVLFAALAAFVIARREFPGREVAVHRCSRWACCSRSTVAILPLLILVRDLGLLDNPLGLALPEAAFGLPLTIIILRPFFRSIPKELEDAAAIDGCGPLGFFFRILLPLSRPALVTVAVLAIVVELEPVPAAAGDAVRRGELDPAARRDELQRRSTRRTRRASSPTRRSRSCRRSSSTSSPSASSSAA